MTFFGLVSVYFGNSIIDLKSKGQYHFPTGTSRGHLRKVRCASPAVRNSSPPYNVAFHHVYHGQVLVLGVQVGEEEDCKAFSNCQKFSYLLVQPRPPIIPKGPQAWAKKPNGKSVRLFLLRKDSLA